MVRVVIGFRLGCEIVLGFQLVLVLEFRLWEGVQLSTRACNSNLKLTRTPIPNPPYRLVLQRTHVADTRLQEVQGLWSGEICIPGRGQSCKCPPPTFLTQMPCNYAKV